MPSSVRWAFAVANAAILLAQAGTAGLFRPEHARLPVAFTAGFLLLWTYLKAKGRGFVADPLLFSALCALTGIGVAVLYRIEPGLGQRQLLWLLFGLAAFALVAHAPLWGVLERYRYLWALLGLLLLLVTALFGREAGGARLWLRFGSVGFQPVEFVKILLIAFLGTHLAESRHYIGAGGVSSRAVLPPLEHLGPLTLMALLFAFLLAVQRDLGAALLLFGVFVAMLYAATGYARYAFLGMGIAVAGAGGAALLFDHVRVRFQVWLDPWSYADGRGYQIIESLFALGAGGLWGRGFGAGLGVRIPAVETDFIFALITEELGLMGAAAVLFLLAIVSVRAIAPTGASEMGASQRLISAGIGLLFALQSALIVGGVTRLLPVTGVTLPLVSYGGSSLLATCVQLGLVYNAQRSAARLHERPLPTEVA